MKSKKRVIQKLVSFESKNSDFKDLSKELEEGWYIASIMPHKENYICVLERAIDGSKSSNQNVTLQEMLAMTKTSRKNKVLQDA